MYILTHKHSPTHTLSHTHTYTHTHTHVHTHTAPGRMEEVEVKNGVSDVNIQWKPPLKSTVTTYLLEISSDGQPYK